MKNKYLLLFFLAFSVQSQADTGTFFTTQYDKAVAGVWGNLESVSGPGSTLEQTKTLCAQLPAVLKKYYITSIIDAPCGDFNWMRTVPINNCNYLGLEVVQELIQKNVKRYQSAQYSFTYCDLLQDQIPYADLIISRDFLVHLSNSDVEKALRNFKLSGSKYLLTTTFVTRINHDIESGDWRPINLQQPPFNLPAPLMIINEKCTEQNGQYYDKSMALWKLEDIYPRDTFVMQLKKKRLWQEGEALKLHLGCGESYLPGYINIDFPSQDHTVQTNAVADVFTDIVKLPLPNESIDEIRLHHVFEHFDRQVALALLCNWHQALKLGGTLMIETPDFEGSARLMLLDSTLSYQEKQAILRHIFGSHEAHWAIHCDGWYEQKYIHVLSQLGFENISIEHSRYLNLCNITVNAVKTKNLSKDQLLFISKEILRESLVADCETKMYEVWCQQLEKTCQ